MMLVDKETGKGYVEMKKVHRDKKEYASKAVGGTALGLSIGALGLQLLAGVASPVDYITQLDNQIQQLTAAKSQIQSQLGNPNQNMQPARPTQPQQAVQQVNLWDEIDKEVCSLNNDQQAILAKDNVYNNVSAELQMLIQQELINSVRDKVANSPRGKELLEKQLNNIRAKKDSIIEEANKELELFKKFQIAAQANPKLTYVDFCNNIKNKEV